ncbi:hypothetical protein [Pseudogulbenkiania sp. MAI-1]|uniref:hypothetical protein n=1 Tax=Pseudogulbenkiania sp. MAI-1 TaxID=990370 RepID=UPI0004B04BB4|nr:hypothetical protein [Pseudogulbenkiania sp. MAI-1]
METNQPMASNRDQMHKTISRWQLLELIGLGNETGLEGTQIRQILAAEYGVNPDYTSRLLVELVQKGYLISQPALPKNGTKGGRNRKVYIRTDKANDLPDKPIPCEAALAVESGPPSQETRAAISALSTQEEALAAAPATQQTQQETHVTETAPPSRQETAPDSGARGRRGHRPITESAATGSGLQQNLPYSLPEAIVAIEGVTAPPQAVSSTPVLEPAIPPNSDLPPTGVAPVPTSMETPPSPDTPSLEATPGAPSAVHDALATAMDQFSDLLLLQVAHKLGAFVANQMAPLERATGELCAQIDILRTQLDTITQHLGSLAAAPAPAPYNERTSATERPTPASAAAPQVEDSAPTGHRPANVIGQGRTKNGKKVPKALAEQGGGLRPPHTGQRKLKALLIGVPSEQEQPIRERFGGRYNLLFLGSDVKYGKVRAIKDQYEIVLGLEDTCSPAIKDALKGHPHKAILPRPSQLMDELEEYFQLQLEQSQTDSVD